MAISDYKISAQDLDGKGNIGMPDTPNLTTQQMQEKLDELSLDVIVPAFNELVDYLNDNVDADHTIKAEDITNLRLDADGKIQVSLDHGTTWITGGASGHLIMDGSGTTYPARSRLQFSQNVIITDNADANKTFVSVYGEKGDKGDGATIRIGEVYDSDVAEVTNSGSETDAIFDFGLPRGEQGAAASIRVGTVTSGANASVYNTGTSEEAVFNFVLPKGDQGDPGTGLTLLDTYATYEELIAAHPTGQRGQAYFVGDSTEGVVYLWSATESAWVNVGELKGQKGDQGDAATITVGTVTEGNTMAVENVGTSTEAVFNFTLVKGDKGDQGNAGTIAIGTVTSGTTPSVTNVGTPTQAILNFVIPKGDKGDKGSPSVVNGKSGDSITLTSGDILLTGYAPVEEYTEILPTDTISEAIAKLEARPGASPMTINVTIDESMIGNTLRAFNLDEEYTQVATSTLTTFNVLNEGVWTVEDVTSGTSAEIELRKDYDVELSAVSYKGWLDSAGITDTFGSLENVLANQITVRKLMTIHASADYLYDWCEIDSEILDTIMDSTYGAKWLGLRDYVCDKFMANESFKGTMLNSPNWGCILKDHVPVMTSNTAPYGTASAYQVFDNSSSTTASGTDFSYTFVNPIMVDKMTCNITGGTLQFSDNGSTWYSNDGGYHLYWRVHFTSSKTVHTVQFYGRALNVSVPIMTSNTTPYGEVICSDYYASDYLPFKVFDGQSNTFWHSTGNNPQHYIGYSFNKDVAVKFMMYANGQNYASRNPSKCEVYGLKDKSKPNELSNVLLNISSEQCSTVPSDIRSFAINNNETYEAYILKLYSSGSDYFKTVSMLQFYGVDYSEREFAQGSTIKYLYDHGIEFEAITGYVTGQATFNKGETKMVLKDPNTSSLGIIHLNNTINLTPYTRVRAVTADELVITSTTTMQVATASNTIAGATASKKLDAVEQPNNNVLDITSVSTALYPRFFVSNTTDNGTLSIAEWWLE